MSADRPYEGQELQLFAAARNWKNYWSSRIRSHLGRSVLEVGAGLGQFISDVLGLPSAVPFAILGMCGFLAGVTQAPLTSFVIVMEMTSQHAMVLPLMLTAAIATTLSKLISPALYQALADRYVASG